MASWEPTSLAELAVDVDTMTTELLGWRDSLAAATGASTGSPLTSIIDVTLKHFSRSILSVSSRKHLELLSYILPLALTVKISIDMEDLFRPPINPDLAFDQVRHYARLVGLCSIDLVRYLVMVKTDLSDKPVFCLGFALLAALAVGQISSLSGSSEPRLASELEALQECLVYAPKGFQELLSKFQEPRDGAQYWKQALQATPPPIDEATTFDLDGLLGTDILPIGVFGDMASMLDVDWASMMAEYHAEPAPDSN